MFHPTRLPLLLLPLLGVVCPPTALHAGCLGLHPGIGFHRWHRAHHLAHGTAGAAHAYTDPVSACIDGGCGQGAGPCASFPERMLSQYIEDPAVWFDDGLRLLRAGRYYEAIEKFRYAADNDAAQPKYRYFQAFAEFQTGLVYQAQASVKLAAAAETEYPISGWGRMMERYQGFTRLWLEKSRRYALAQLGAT